MFNNVYSGIRGGGNYSTDEQVIGKQIDDKSIYQKTVEIPWSGNVDEGTELYRSINEAKNIDTVVSCEVCCTANSGVNKDFEGYQSITVKTQGDDVVIVGTKHINGIANVKATYRYTKKTN